MQTHIMKYKRFLFRKQYNIIVYQKITTSPLTHISVRRPPFFTAKKIYGRTKKADVNDSIIYDRALSVVCYLYNSCEHYR